MSETYNPDESAGQMSFTPDGEFTRQPELFNDTVETIPSTYVNTTADQVKEGVVEMSG